MQFEHRDLHWGNILVAPVLDELGAKKGVKATIIDFTLSRASLIDEKGGKEVLAGGLEDEEIFQGEGDYQFECYRIMKRLVQGEWERYCPGTNVVVSCCTNTDRSCDVADLTRLTCKVAALRGQEAALPEETSEAQPRRFEE